MCTCRLARLEFGTITIRKALATAAVTHLTFVVPAAAQDWLSEEEDNPFTGKKDAWASFTATKATVGDQMVQPFMRLFLACLEGELDYSIEAGAYIGNMATPVRYRFDDAEPVTERWVPSDNGTAVFLPRTYKDFRKGIAEAEKFAFEVTDFRGVSYRSIFEGLSENRAVLDQVSAVCK